MKDLTTGFTKTYTWALTFGKDENRLGLYHKKDSAVLAEIIVCNRWVEWILFHLPFGYTLWNKVLLWSSTKEEQVLSLEATPEMLAILSPEDRWLWDESYEDPEQ